MIEQKIQVSEQLAKYVAALVNGTHEITSVTIRPKREWVGLTDEDIWEEVYEYFNTKEDGYYFCFAQAIEAKLREKNA